MQCYLQTPVTCATSLSIRLCGSDYHTIMKRISWFQQALKVDPSPKIVQLLSSLPLVLSCPVQPRGKRGIHAHQTASAEQPSENTNPASSLLEAASIADRGIRVCHQRQRESRKLGDATYQPMYSRALTVQSPSSL